MKNAQKWKCSKSDKTNTIASSSSSWFRWYNFYVKRSPPSQTGKNFDFADCAVRTVRTVADVACPHVWHMTSPYRTRGVSRAWKCQAVLAFLVYGWTNPEVTRVTTGRVTRGTGWRQQRTADDVVVLTGRTADDVAWVTWQLTERTARWRVIMTERTEVTWQRRVAVTWVNQRWTRGIFWLDGMNESPVDTWHTSVGCEGATWPNHGLPRGTPRLANEG
jgi:hypothetical protein